MARFSSPCEDRTASRLSAKNDVAEYNAIVMKFVVELNIPE